MSHVRMALAVVAATCAFAAASASASPAQFTAGQGQMTTGTFAVRGASGTEDGQAFDVAGAPIKCATAHAKGTLTLPETGKMLLSLVFGGCTTDVQLGEVKASVKVAVKGPLQLEYTPQRGVRVLTPVAVLVKAIGCTFELASPKEEVGESPNPELTVVPKLQPEAATYAEEKVSTTRLRAFPTGFQRKLLVTTHVLFLTSVSGSSCKAETAGSTGSGAGAGKGGALSELVGTMPVETLGGDLGIEEETAEFERVKNAPE